VKFTDHRTRELLLRTGLASAHRFVEIGWAASLGADATGIDLNEDNLAVAASWHKR
jgi:hypothetical protein